MGSRLGYTGAGGFPSPGSLTTTTSSSDTPPTTGIVVGIDHKPELVNFSFHGLEYLSKVLEVILILMLAGKDPVY